MSDISFGKKITHESFFNGRLRSTKTEYSIPLLVQTNTQAMNEIMKCLELITKKETDKVTIVIDADPVSGAIKMVTKSYEVSQ